MSTRPGIRSALQGLAIVTLAALAGKADAQAINVEIDWLVGTGGHDHEPADCELEAVEAAFARNGITLNLVKSNAIFETAGLMEIDLVTPSPFENGEWAALEATHRDQAAGTGWHYMLFGHNYSLDGNSTSSSGFAEITGDECLVSLGDFTNSVGTPFSRAGTLMHELGHNLGLRHAGDQDEFIIRQYKPNYPSVMSYRFQLNGVKNGMECSGLTTTGAFLYNLDYSQGLLAPLDEGALDESIGIGFGPVDWDCSSTIGGVVAQDVSSDTYWCPWTGAQSILTDYDDWSNATSVADNPPLDSQVIGCMTLEDRDRLLESNPCLQPDPCLVVGAVPTVPSAGLGVLALLLPVFALIWIGTRRS